MDRFLQSALDIWKVLTANPSFAVPMVIGAYLFPTICNAFIAVLVEDPLKDAWRRLLRKSKDWNRRGLRKTLAGKPFSLDGVYGGMIVYDVNFSGYGDDVCFGDLINDRGVKAMPQSLRPAFDGALGRYNTELSKQRMFSELKMGLQDFSVLRGKSHLEAGFRFRFEPRTYAEQQAATEVYRNLSENDRERVLGEQPSPVARAFSNTFGVSVVVTTSDRKLVIGKRSRYVRANKGKRVFGAVEGANERDVDWKTQRVLPRLTAIRGLETELGIRSEAELRGALKLVSLVLNYEFYEWNMIAILDCAKLNPELSSYDILTIFQSGRAYDKFEYDSIEFIEFNPQSVCRFIKNERESITNYSQVGVLLALYDRFDAKVVDRELRRAT